MARQAGASDALVRSLLANGAGAQWVGGIQDESEGRVEVCMDLPGSFVMGYTLGDLECPGDEKPPHQVTITKGFWIGQTPVTQAAFERVMGGNPSHFRAADLPVEQVTWDQSVSYCHIVGGRLPTEAQWKYAARAGTTQNRCGDLNAIAWWGQNSGPHIQWVKSRLTHGACTTS